MLIICYFTVEMAYSIGAHYKENLAGASLWRSGSLSCPYA